MTLFQSINKFKSHFELAKQFSACNMKALIQSNYESFSLNGIKVHQVNIFNYTPDTNELLRFTGFSSDSVRLAAIKSFSEYLEAISLYNFKNQYEKSRSGCATGYSFDIALKNAYLELIERDSFISHFLCPELNSQPIINKFYNSIELVRLQSSDNTIVVVMATLKNENYYYIGLGASENEKIAIEKSVLEVMMLKKDWQPYPLGYIPRTERANMFFKHWQAGHTLEVINRINKILNGKGKLQLPSNSNINKSKILFHNIYSPKHHTVYITHPELLILTFGEIWQNYKISAQSIMSKRGLPIDLEKWYTHPLL